jgi:hypothetical protein
MKYEPRHLSWFVFAIHLPLPLTDASDAATRTKRYPESTTKRVDTDEPLHDDEDGRKRRCRGRGTGSRKEGKGRRGGGRDNEEEQGQTVDGRDDKEEVEVVGRDEQEKGEG